MYASAVLIPDTKYVFPIGEAIIWTSGYVWTRWWKELLLVVTEIDCDLSSHNGRKTEIRIGTFWRQIHRHCRLYGAALRLFKTLLMTFCNVMIPGGPGRLAACCYGGMVIDASLKWSSCRKTKQCRSIIADDARAFSPPGCAWRGCSGKETTADRKDLKLK